MPTRACQQVTDNTTHPGHPEQPTLCRSYWLRKCLSKVVTAIDSLTIKGTELTDHDLICLLFI